MRVAKLLVDKYKKEISVGFRAITTKHIFLTKGFLIKLMASDDVLPLVRASNLICAAGDILSLSGCANRASIAFFSV